MRCKQLMRGASDLRDIRGKLESWDVGPPDHPLKQPTVPAMIPGAYTVLLPPSVDRLDELLPLGPKRPWDGHVAIDPETFDITTGKVPPPPEGVKPLVCTQSSSGELRSGLDVVEPEATESGSCTTRHSNGVAQIEADGRREGAKACCKVGCTDRVQDGRSYSGGESALIWDT